MGKVIESKQTYVYLCLGVEAWWTLIVEGQSDHNSIWLNFITFTYL